MPISNVDVNDRDVHPASVARPTGIDPLILSQILGAPDVVDPTGVYGYDPRVSGRKDFLPVTVDVVGHPSSDLRLIDIIQNCLETSKRPAAVRTGSRMFERGKIVNCSNGWLSSRLNNSVITTLLRKERPPLHNAGLPSSAPSFGPESY